MSLTYKTVLGFDFGMKYIGVATGQFVTKQSTPLTSIAAKDGIPNWEVLSQIITEWQPKHLVVGIPIPPEGAEQHVFHAAKKFAARLKQRYDLPVALVDETLSSWEAKHNISGKKLNTCKRKDLLKLNAKAAAIILEDWLGTQ